MRLASRLIRLLVLTLAVLVVVDGFFEYEQERTLVSEGMERDARVLGRAMSAMLADAWRTSGKVRVHQLIEDANAGESDVGIRWVWLDAAPGTSAAPRLSETANLLSRKRRTETAARSGEELVSYFAVDSGPRRGALELSQSTAEFSLRAGGILQRTVLQLAALFLIAALTAYFLGIKLVGRPLGKLMAKIERVSVGDLSDPIRLDGDSELTRLAEALNTMCERLSETQERVAEESAARIAAIEQARHADRLRTVGQLASGVAHELGTPLNVVGGRAALIVEGQLDADDTRASAEIICGQADRMAGIVRQLLDFARHVPSEKQRVDVRRVVREGIELVTSAAKKKRVVVDLEPEEGSAIVEGDPSALQQVLTNLVLNAIHASFDDGGVRVAVGIKQASPPEGCSGRWIRVDVRDEGEGIAQESLPRVFEPFFTTKDVGEGTGLGLSIAHEIVRDLGGWFAVESEEGKGSCFTFYLPVAPEEE